MRRAVLTRPLAGHEFPVTMDMKLTQEFSRYTALDRCFCFRLYVGQSIPKWGIFVFIEVFFRIKVFIYVRNQIHTNSYNTNCVVTPLLHHELTIQPLRAGCQAAAASTCGPCLWPDGCAPEVKHATRRCDLELPHQVCWCLWAAIPRFPATRWYGHVRQQASASDVCDPHQRVLQGERALDGATCLQVPYIQQCCCFQI